MLRFLLFSFILFTVKALVIPTYSSLSARLNSLDAQRKRQAQEAFLLADTDKDACLNLKEFMGYFLNTENLFEGGEDMFAATVNRTEEPRLLLTAGFGARKQLFSEYSTGDYNKYEEDNTQGQRSLLQSYEEYSDETSIAPPSPSFSSPPSSSYSLLTVVSGLCQTSSEGTCLQSPNYPADYNNDDSCEVSVDGEGVLYSLSFQTEENYDFFYVGSTQYSGQEGPNGHEVNSSVVLHFISDSSVMMSGFEVCVTDAPPPTPPSPPSPPPPPPSPPSPPPSASASSTSS
ncbi:hypothetical protein CYMTET_38418 [Cymbomonas tetramitiformis]|uniref:EF-hand domain-containing protein n=1 Tax=Cymbomonas tetramitiformis TaxID=36881 RepID=A0AAE0CDT5_9CHLO|nr:hypothetical protein CYMTET_38418 [Cymbomonas tetramitiformis]